MLGSGSRVGPYEILAPLGAGGMGEVYRARDLRLKRDVALKILPDLFSQDPDRVARFQREAELLAALNHPHIAHIHGIEDAGGVKALVMELVEGETLADLIARGPVPMEDALAIARQMAEALEAAHDRGVIHRDLKPGNVKVTPDGTVKVLDFGLAKALEPAAFDSGPHAGARAEARANSPTITSPVMTRAGLILGTAAYMSPEQARGKAVDKRADIWAFGVVLYEMLAGRRLFAGDEPSDVLAGVLRQDVDWTALPAATPRAVRRLLARCLERDPKQRLHDIGDVRLEIDEAIKTPAAEATPVAARRRAAGPAVLLALATTAVVFAVLGGIIVRRLPTSTPANAPVTRFAIDLAPGEIFRTVGRSLDISRDGSRILYATSRGVFVRTLATLEARMLPNTEPVQGALSPAFSPDGQSIAFWATRDQTIRTLDLDGNTAVKIGEAFRDASGFFSGLTWDVSGILLGQNVAGGVLRVHPGSGQPETLVKIPADARVSAPRLLPGGDRVLFSLVKGNQGPAADAQVVVQSLKTGERKTVIDRGIDARYLPSGHLVYMDGGILFAVRFDVERLERVGQPVLVVEGIRRAGLAMATAHYSVSDTGTLVYVPGPATGSDALSFALFDRNGASQPLKVAPGAYNSIRVSPGRARIAFSSDDGKEATVWIYDLAETSSMRRLTFGGQNRFPIWSADGERVAFRSDREGDAGIFWQRAGGSGTAERLTRAEPGTIHTPESWSPGNRVMLFDVMKDSRHTLWALARDTGKATPFGGVESSSPLNASFSPDGRWVAYGTVAADRPFSTVYVQPFPATGAIYQVSRDDDGHHPVWSRDGRQLIYIPGPNRLAMVAVAAGSGFTFSPPATLPPAGIMGPPGIVRNYDVTADARFVGVSPGGDGTGLRSVQQMHVVINWFEELRQKVK